MSGKSSHAQQKIVELNAAFGIYVSGKVGSLEDAAEMASESISSGRAKEKLNLFIETSRGLA
jgi:anthranilate phosphoribosyltransferase